MKKFKKPVSAFPKETPLTTHLRDLDPATRALRAAFEELCEGFKSSDSHLDSLLSRLPPAEKSFLAPRFRLLLQKPASLARAFRLPIPDPGPFQELDLEWAWQMMEMLADDDAFRQAAALPGTTADFPPEMVEVWVKDWGEEASERLAKALTTHPPVTVRLGRKVDRAAMFARWKSEIGSVWPHVKVRLTEVSPFGIELSDYVPILSSPWSKPNFEKGEFEIQDEGSQVMSSFVLWPEVFGSALSATPLGKRGTVSAAPLPRLKPLNVVDACSGAGGKALAMGDFLMGQGRLYAYDVYPKKLLATRQRARKTELRNIQTVEVVEESEEAAIANFFGKSDAVLVDAPCGGWGVLRRNPDIKWRPMTDLSALQLRLLGVYSKLVKTGGKLTFGVCTFRKKESLDVCVEFEKAHPEFVRRTGGYFGPAPSDGFFMMQWEKTAK